MGVRPSGISKLPIVLAAALIVALAALWWRTPGTKSEVPSPQAPKASVESRIDSIVEHSLKSWRAPGAAIGIVRGDRLIYLGRSSTQVRSNFAPAFFEVLDDEEREHVCSISLQRWHGAPDAGRWLHQTNLNIPVKAKLARSAVGSLPEPPPLPY